MTRSIIHRTPKPDPTDGLNSDQKLDPNREQEPDLVRHPGQELNGEGDAGQEPMTELSAADLVAAELAAHRRRWPFLAAGLVVGAAATYGVVAYLDRTDGEPVLEAEAVTLSTAPVESRDLLEEVEWSGTLQYGDPISVSAGSGTVTAATGAGAGAELVRGDSIADVDGEPIVLLYGQRPLWRALSEGTEGPDVLLLESNLVALGYDPDLTVSVDEVFTANTELMVERWQEDIGREITGVVAVTDVALVPGPSVLTDAATIGADTGGTLATVSTLRTVTDVVSAVAGQVTNPLPVGSSVEHGMTLFLIDEVPVVAVTATAVSEDPVLSVLTSATFTDLELEQALADAGHDADGDMTIDGSVTDATTAVIETWQAAAALPVTGLAKPGYYQVLPEDQTVDAHLSAEVASSATGPVLTVSSSELRVEVEVAVADADEFSEGQPVTIELVDEQVVDGIVLEIGPLQRADNQSDPTVTIIIDVVATADQELVEGNVTVTTVSESIEGATTVPTRALISLAEGGFAVEVTDPDGSTRLVGVELGAFDDGHVEVTNESLTVGDLVVVPQ